MTLPRFVSFCFAIFRALISFDLRLGPLFFLAWSDGYTHVATFTLAFLATFLVECNAVTNRKLFKKLRRRHHRSLGPS